MFSNSGTNSYDPVPTEALVSRKENSTGNDWRSFKRCAKMGNHKAPGPEGIPNIALKTEVKAAPKIFVCIFNWCLRQGSCPPEWKKQRLVLLPQGKKPSSWHHLHETWGYSRGFRKGRSTVDGINLLYKDYYKDSSWDLLYVTSCMTNY